MKRELVSHLHNRDAGFYQKWLHKSMAEWHAEPSKGRFAFEGVASVIFGVDGMEIETPGDGLSYIFGVLGSNEQSEFKKALVSEVQAIIVDDKTNKKLQLGSLFILIEAAYLTGTRGIIPLLPQLKTGFFDLSQGEEKKLNDLVRDAYAGLDVQAPKSRQPVPRI